MVKAPPAPVEQLRIQKATPDSSVTIQLNRSVSDMVFYHSGDIGDIIYALAFIKSAGGGRLFIGPDTKWETYSKYDHRRYEWLMPLLQVQPYLKWVAYSEGRPPSVTHDLNEFREVWMNPDIRGANGVSRLFEAYPKRFGFPPLSESEPWLTVSGPIFDKDRAVVISRSARYRNLSFPWKEVARRYAYQMRFIGHAEEFEDWCKLYGRYCQYVPCDSALVLAQVIAGSRFFIGNQSCPNAIAIGLGVPIIQETDPVTQDCVFHRSNCQYFHLGPIKWPVLPKRYVIPVPNEKGIFELGPCAGAYGIGDSLTITPLIDRLQGKCVLKLPPEMETIAPLFTDLCPIEFTDDHPEFVHESNNEQWHMAEAKLRAFNLWPSDILPKMKITAKETTWAKQELSRANQIVFVPTCKKEWAYIRQQPPEFWREYIQFLSRKFLVLQFGYADYPLIEPAVRMTGYRIRQIAALYSVIGRYIGVDTGDVHMMLAVGGNCTVFNPPKQPRHIPAEWEYPTLRAKYVDPKDKEACDAAVEWIALQNENHLHAGKRPAALSQASA